MTGRNFQRDGLGQCPSAAAPFHDPTALLSVRQVAELQGTSLDYVYDVMKSGELRVIELGRGRSKRRVTRVDFEKFVTSRLAVV
ncbi:helix-turn-helix domain-containing protein [Subtercola sp. RTI3]|uniref:helix-turn-helix domain-containing protein n=1 Tax=Subtercola sp. RTI3 TaxID=3048639 RepID=UPI002B222207|nr:helix-turn-helix domain-containing protein [Subtercola sp. RTI3]MEA9984895.1 helix-turn-helix domain-containing protein [Subtercola sp. RTI3]